MMSYMIPIYLAAASRMAGDARLKWLGVVLYPWPYVCVVYGAITANSVVYSILASTVCYFWVLLWKISGHADGYRGYVRDNTLSRGAIPLSEFLSIHRNTAAYDAIFWMIKGGIMALCPAVIIAVFAADYPLAGALFVTSAVGYAAAYWLGFNVLNKRLGMVNTAWGELLAGFFSGMGFLFA